LAWLDEGGCWCRAKVDWLPHEPSAWLWDLKTVSSHATLRKWVRAAYDQQADLQAVFHCRGSEFLHGEPPAGLNFCVIENKPPHGIAVFSLGPMAVEIGEAKARHAIRTWAQCLETNSWPSYPIEQQWVEPPAWVLREWQHLTPSGASPKTRLTQSDNLADRIVEQGSWGG
jgi:exodeoxyribonuclease VIII